jgi:hypothetical protein
MDTKEKIVKQMVEPIRKQALLLGWKPEQLDRYMTILSVFLPAQIGHVRREWIETIILHEDGSFRGANRFYNFQINLP